MKKEIEEILERNYGYIENEQVIRELLGLFNVSSSKLKVGDSFTLQVKKPKTTVGKEYKVSRIVADTEQDSIEYWFFNDHDKPSVMYEGDYYC